MKSISTKELKNIIDINSEETIIVDVRTRSEHKSNRIPDVLNIPLDEIEGHLQSLKKYKTVYVHCHSGNRSAQAYKKLISAGLNHVINIEGGISDWEKCGFPTIKTSSIISLTRQVFIAAGILIILGVTLSNIYPSFIYLSVFVGLGLLTAGITGWCGMAHLLARMPWNKG